MVFTALSLADTINFNSVNNFNYGIRAAADYYSVIRRVQEVLLHSEKKDQHSVSKLEPPKRLIA